MNKTKATRTQLDVYVSVLCAIDRWTGDEFLWVPAGVERQVSSGRIRR